MALRVRLAVLNALVLASAILLLSGLAYAQLANTLSAEIDASLQNQATSLGDLYLAREALPPRARERLIPQPSLFSPTPYLVQILDADQNVVERSNTLESRELPIHPEAIAQADAEDNAYENVTLDGQRFRLETLAVAPEDQSVGYVQIARSLQPMDEELDLLRATLVRAGAAMGLISLVVAWLLAGAFLRPIARITQAARDIALSGRLDRRLPPLRSRDEVARLAETFNRMMERLETAFWAQRRFVADASHELRTPLTTIRGNLEIIRRSKVLQTPDMAEAVDDVLMESERMSRLVDGLLELARADAGQELAREPVQLDDLVQTVCREIQPLSNGVQVMLDHIAPVELIGDPDALKQLILILVDNGVKYTPPPGTVTIDMQSADHTAVLTVRDTGPGIAPDDLPHIFERFYRAPSARGAGGTGLGLAIAEWIVKAHDGSIEVQSSRETGTVFTVHLPVANGLDNGNATTSDGAYTALNLSLESP